MWGSKQYIFFSRELETNSIEIKSDEDMLEWFECNLNKRVAQINAQVNEFVGPLQCSPTKRRCHPSLRNKVHANERGTKKKRATKAKSKGAHDDECVGVDEEGTHSDTDSLVAPSDSSYDSDLAASSDSADGCSDPEFDPDGEVFDDDDEYDPHPFSYDVDDPTIDVGIVFP
ncbi:hypothetical protein PVAP13_7NG273524, partial [Panicum virgatum]